MKDNKYIYIAVIILFFNNLIVLYDLYEIRNKINEIEQRNLEVHEYILNRIEVSNNYDIINLKGR